MLLLITENGLKITNGKGTLLLVLVILKLFYLEALHSFALTVLTKALCHNQRAQSLGGRYLVSWPVYAPAHRRAGGRSSGPASRGCPARSGGSRRQARRLQPGE